MSTFVALLRGINVGKAKRIPMEALRTTLEELGYANVRTLLNSGNVVFESPDNSATAHAKAITNAIAVTFTFEVPVIVKSALQFDLIKHENPYADVTADNSRIFVAFTQDETSLSTLKKVEALVTPDDRFIVGRHAAYLYCSAGVLESSAGKALLGKFGRSSTTRNWATTLKLYALIGRDA